MAITNENAREPSRFRTSPSLNRVQKILRHPGTTPGGSESSRQPVIPPAPLTGDVGRGCGDASRALLLSAKKGGPPQLPPHVPTLIKAFQTSSLDELP